MPGFNLVSTIGTGSTGHPPTGMGRRFHSLQLLHHIQGPGPSRAIRVATFQHSAGFPACEFTGMAGRASASSPVFPEQAISNPIIHATIICHIGRVHNLARQEHSITQASVMCPGNIIATFLKLKWLAPFRIFISPSSGSSKTVAGFRKHLTFNIQRPIFKEGVN